MDANILSLTEIWAQGYHSWWNTRETHVFDVKVELVGNDAQLGESEGAGNLLGFVVWVCPVPHKLMEPGRVWAGGAGEVERGGGVEKGEKLRGGRSGGRVSVN